MIPAVFLSNKNGIPRIASSGVTVGTSDVKITIRSDRSFANNYNGVILLKLSQEIPTGTTTTLPIILTSNVGDQPVLKRGNTAYTVADFRTGIHLAYYESNTNTLQIIA